MSPLRRKVARLRRYAAGQTLKHLLKITVSGGRPAEERHRPGMSKSAWLCQLCKDCTARMRFIAEAPHAEAPHAEAPHAIARDVSADLSTTLTPHRDYLALAAA
jgi:hypothetical protein